MDWVRTGLDIGVGRWRALLIAFCLFSATVMAIETVAAVATFARGTEGRLGTKGDAVMHDGRVAVSVTGFEPWSLAPQAGVRVGDLMRRDRWVDGRHLRPGESIAVTVVRDGVAMPAQVTAAERPIDALAPWHFGLSAVLCWSGTLLGLVIGLRQAEVRTSRALSLAFLWWSANLGWGYAPAYWPAAVVLLTQSVALMPGWYLGLWFAIHYPDERPQGLRHTLRRVLPLFLLALVAVEVAAVAWALDRGSQALFSWTQLPYMGAAGVLMLVCFWDGWRHSSGELRQRFSWLLGSFALMWAVSYATWFGDWLATDDVQRWLGRVSVLGSLTALFGLTYAILRHRVLDMGLALNRSLVFAVVGAVLLGGFQFLNVLAGRLLHFDDPAKAGLMTAVLAGFVVLAYPKVKPRAEWLVDRLFFGAWVAREADLARFAADARGFTDSAALAAALVGALDRFTTGAGAAFYVRERDGRFTRQPGATIDAPDTAGADEPLAVALRAGRPVARGDEVHSALPGELAMVLSRQRELDAFVLVGRQRDGRALRADEVVALRDAVRTAGAEWQALRWQALQRLAGG